MTTTTSSGFSFHRLSMVARYYYPSLRLQLWLYPLIAISIGITQYALTYTEIGFLFSGLLSTVINFMVYFGPAVFARYSDRYLETMLPANALEKAAIIIPYCLIAIPLFTWGLNSGTINLLDTIFGKQNTIMVEIEESARQLYSSNLRIIAEVQEYVPIATCMFAVVALRHHRAIMGAVWSVVSLIVMAIIGAVYGIMTVMTNTTLGEVAKGNIDADTYIESISFFDKMEIFLYIFCGLCVAYILLMIWLTIRKLSKIQL